jgi:hypothetical protein
LTIGSCADREPLLGSARSVLTRNWTGASTVPSRYQYPHQWGWDAAFIAIGSAWLDTRRAVRELESQLRGQWADGRIPHIVFDPDVSESAYFPGPAFWRSDRASAGPRGVRTSGLIQPPLQPRALLEVVRHCRDGSTARGLVRRVLPALAAQHDYLRNRRDAGGGGLAAIVHPWEAGLDDSPAWDAPLAAVEVPADGAAGYARRDQQHVDPAERPTDAAYDRFVQLAHAYRETGYSDDHLAERVGFCVEDPLFNAIWLWSTHALIELAEIAGAEPGAYRAAAADIHEGLMSRLWDPATRRFLPRDLTTGRRIDSQTVLSLGPLLHPGLPTDVVAALAADLASERFRSPEGWGVASADLTGPDFDLRRYWRGPIWVNLNWLLARGLRQHGLSAQADALDATTLRLVAKSGMREYFDPLSGDGRGVRDFSWTAALVTDIISAQDGE